MESLMESGILWSLLLEQDSQSLRWCLKLFTNELDSEHCCGHGSEEIPAVSV
jgi:hypothetical protein